MTAQPPGDLVKAQPQEISTQVMIIKYDNLMWWEV